MRLSIALGAAVLFATTPALAEEPTDFGIRTVDGGRMTDSSIKIITPPSSAAALGPFVMAEAVTVGRRWGTVTSTYRSPAHNRRVGGAPNSWHLQGRAIDIARRPGVTHGQIAAAYRNAGFRLIESLDEGDHSHFAFASGGVGPLEQTPTEVRPAMQMVKTGPAPTDFRIVTVGAAR